MNPILMIVIAVVVGVGLAILYNKFVITYYPENRRTGKYVATIIVFLLVSVALCGVLIAQSIVTETIKVQSSNLEQLIKNSNPNSALVKNGVDLSKFNDPAQINTIVNEIRALLPSSAQIGMNKAIYDIIMNYAMNQLYGKLMLINIAVEKGNLFTDENNILTVSSIIGGLQKIILNVVKITCMIIMGIIIILFVVYVLTSLVTAMKAKKSMQAPAETA